MVSRAFSVAYARSEADRGTHRVQTELLATFSATGESADKMDESPSTLSAVTIIPRSNPGKYLTILTTRRLTGFPLQKPLAGLESGCTRLARPSRT